MTVTYDEAKFTELLLYAARLLEDDHAGGATKLNKLLFFAEFAHVRRTGEPITGAEYQKLERGPAPRRLLPVRDALVQRGEAELVEEVTAFGYVQDRFRPLREPRLEVFSDEEIDTIEKVAGQLRGLTAAQVSALSHEELGWQMVDDGETIPYSSAYLRQPEITPAVREHARRLVKELGRA